MRRRKTVSRYAINVRFFSPSGEYFAYVEVIAVDISPSHDVDATFLRDGGKVRDAIARLKERTEQHEARAGRKVKWVRLPKDFKPYVPDIRTLL